MTEETLVYDLGEVKIDSGPTIVAPRVPDPAPTKVSQRPAATRRENGPAAFAPRAYEPAGLRLAVAMMGNTEDARDALQDAFVKAYDALHRFDLRRPFGPWFFQILRNQCRDMLRSRQAT